MGRPFFLTGRELRRALLNLAAVTHTGLDWWLELDIDELMVWARDAAGLLPGAD